MRVVKSFNQLGAAEYGDQWPGGDSIVAEIDRNIVRDMGGSFGAMFKALANQNLAGYGDGTPLLLENLDDRMTTVLYEESMLVLWNMLERTVSRQPYYEWNERLRYGGGRRAPGFAEGGVPKNASAKWQRKGAYVQYLGVKRGITHQALIAGSLGGYQVSPAEEEERDGTLDLLATIERWFFWGDADIKPSGSNQINYDGILKQMEQFETDGRLPAGVHIIDKKGEPFVFDDIENGGLTLLQRGKIATTEKVKFVCHPKVEAGLALQKMPSERAIISHRPDGKYIAGTPMAGYESQLGTIMFNKSIFLDEVELDVPLTAAANVEPTAPAAPATPTIAVSADTGADWADTYYYFASAMHDGGESLATASASQVVAVDEKATVTIPRVTDAAAYRVYRGTESDGSDAKIIATVPQPTSGDATYEDRNQRIPGTHVSFMFNNDPRDLVVAQMAPLLKYPLGVTSTTIEFLLLLYHALIVKAPERLVIWKNIGDYATP